MRFWSGLCPANGDFVYNKKLAVVNAWSTMHCLKNIQMIILLTVALLFGVSCTDYATKQYEGKVVDEQGEPIQNVEVTLCYTGWDWDWSMPGGFPLTMGKPFCSETVTTDRFGNYKATFAGPQSTVLYARHPEWVQTRSFLAKNNRVVMIRREEYNRRRADKEAKRENAFRRRVTGESDTEYYCRVIRQRSENIEMVYHGRRVKIFQTLMSNGHLLFAGKGVYDDIKAIAKEMSVSIDNAGEQLLSDDFTVLPDTISCGDDIYFIATKSYVYTTELNSGEKVNAILSGLRAGFPMYIWEQQ